MSHVTCSRCGSERPPELAAGAPRTPCPECGETAITVSHELTGTMTMNGSMEAKLRAGDQERGWARRWKEIERELAELFLPQTGDVSGEKIHAARHRLHSFYIQAYHLKDALKEAAGSTGIGKETVEAAIDAEPALALLADLANLDKHGNLNKPPRSGHVPKVIGASGTSSSEVAGWRLELEIEHAGKRLDGLRVGEDAVAAWRKVLTGWGLI